MKFVGLDCEWVNKKGVLSHPVALLQIATPLNDCFLIRLCKMSGAVPPTLKGLLEDRAVLKFGVGIMDDAKKLSDTFGLAVSGCVDLRHLVLRQGKLSLGALAQRFLGVRMDKSWHVQCSNWEVEHLSDRQVAYAANDAIVAVHVFMALDYFSRTIFLEKMEMDFNKGYISSTTEMLSDEKFCENGLSLCKGVVDLGFKQKQKPNKMLRHGGEEDFSKNKPYRLGFTERKSPLYTNCQLQAPDGTVLSTLERKKADWYLDKGIGELVAEDPYTVRLKFEPSGRPDEEDKYYLTFKQNICVVCGQGDSYLRKNIVPHEYRRHFPLCMKDHHSHDIVLMCPECHRVSAFHDEHLRQRLAREYDAPLGNKELSRVIHDPILTKIRSAAKALIHAGDKIPPHRRQELQEIVQSHYHATELTPELIEEAAAMDTSRENVNFKSHGEEVVKRVRELGKLLDFEKLWRRNFVDSMNPQYLPEFWSVNHRYEKM
ncbi:predicted protein, partial [Nematostella vectensis]